MWEVGSSIQEVFFAKPYARRAFLLHIAHISVDYIFLKIATILQDEKGDILQTCSMSVGFTPMFKIFPNVLLYSALNCGLKEIAQAFCMAERTLQNFVEMTISTQIKHKIIIGCVCYYRHGNR